MDTKTRERTGLCRGCRPVAARYVFCALAFTGNMISFTLKVSLSVAVVAMVEPRDNSTAGTPADNRTASSQEVGGGYDWDELTQSTVLAGMQYGVLLSCVPAARLAELFGPRFVSGPSLGIASLLHLLCPLVAPLGAPVFIAFRVLQGVFSGAYSPGLSTLLIRWVPLQERGVTVSTIYTAVNLGILFSMALTGKISTDWGWPAVFYFYGGLGCVWTVMWMLFVYDSPSDHPRISAEEKDFILANVASESKVTFPVPWIAILTSLPVWSYLAIKVGAVYLLYIFLTELPTYMKNILNFNLSNAGYLSALPYVFSTVTNIVLGTLSQWLRTKGYLSHLVAYKIFNAIGLLGPAAMMLAITLVEDATIIIVLIVFTMILQGGFFGGSVVNHLELSPNFAATISGLTDIVTEAMSILAPTIVGALTNGEQTRARWQIVFYTSSAIIGFPYVVYFFFASVQEQSWNKPKESHDKNENADKVAAA